MKQRIYLDNASTTAVAPEVLKAMLPYFIEEFGNASSTHLLGQQARSAIETARHNIAKIIGATNQEIVFLSGATEANNLALKGIAQSYIKHGNHIIVSAFEHPSILGPTQWLEEQGFSITRLPVYEEGIVRIEDVSAAITDKTILISVMAANNEVGTLQPLEAIGNLIQEVRLKQPHIYFHTDAVQAIGKIPINVNKLGIDLLSLSGHKLHAPKGIGALYVRKNVKLSAQQIGGHQERDRRAGTENVPGIVALGQATKLASSQLSNINNVIKLRNLLEESLIDKLPFLRINGNITQRLPNISSLSFGKINAESLLIALDLHGIAVSTGSACSSGSTEPSHVLKAMGFSKERIHNSLRFSLSSYSTKEEIEQAVKILLSLVNP